MITIKLPDPIGATYTIAGVQHCTLTRDGPDSDLFTADQLKQFARDVLEDAADQWDDCVYDSVGESIDIGSAIRAMKEQIK